LVALLIAIVAALLAMLARPAVVGTYAYDGGSHLSSQTQAWFISSVSGGPRQSALATALGVRFRSPPASGFAAEDGVTVYRGTSLTSELQIHAETGQLMSDAARVGYVESGGSVEAAQAASEAAHASGIQAWGSEGAYAEAHSAFGTELSQIGPRSMISVKTDPAVTKYFAGEAWLAAVSKA
jgi:hypothetical protein